jgi:hypothetical protein
LRDWTRVADLRLRPVILVNSREHQLGAKRPGFLAGIDDGGQLGQALPDLVFGNVLLYGVAGHELSITLLSWHYNPGHNPVLGVTWTA